jgi:transcriptional regulator with XRE-family HTH domain
MSNKPLDPKRFPRCPECGGEVRLLAREGRTREYLRGVSLAVPSDYEIPTCTSCGEELMNVEVSGPLDTLLAEGLKGMLRGYVDAIRMRHTVTQQEIEDALGITRSYLSHVLAGRNEPSPTLVKMLRLLAEVPGAFENAAGRKRVKKNIPAPKDFATHVVWISHFQLAPSYAVLADSAWGEIERPRTTRRVSKPAYTSPFEMGSLGAPVPVGHA